MDSITYDVAPKGWICPKCGRVYSPTTPMCFFCSNEQFDITVSSRFGKGEPLFNWKAPDCWGGGRDGIQATPVPDSSDK